MKLTSTTILLLAIALGGCVSQQDDADVVDAFARQDAIIGRCNQIYMALTKPYAGAPKTEADLERLASRMLAEKSPLHRILRVPEEAVHQAVRGNKSRETEVYVAVQDNAEKVLRDPECAGTIYDYVVPMLFGGAKPVDGTPLADSYSKVKDEFSYDSFLFLLLLERNSLLDH